MALTISSFNLELNNFPKNIQNSKYSQDFSQSTRRKKAQGWQFWEALSICIYSCYISQVLFKVYTSFILYLVKYDLLVWRIPPVNLCSGGTTTYLLFWWIPPPDLFARAFFGFFGLCELFARNCSGGTAYWFGEFHLCRCLLEVVFGKHGPLGAGRVGTTTTTTTTAAAAAAAIPAPRTWSWEQHTATRALTPGSVLVFFHVTILPTYYRSKNGLLGHKNMTKIRVKFWLKICKTFLFSMSHFQGMVCGKWSLSAYHTLESEHALSGVWHAESYCWTWWKMGKNGAVLSQFLFNTVSLAEQFTRTLKSEPFPRKDTWKVSTFWDMSYGSWKVKCNSRISQRNMNPRLIPNNREDNVN